MYDIKNDVTVIFLVAFFSGILKACLHLTLKASGKLLDCILKRIPKRNAAISNLPFHGS